MEIFRLDDSASTEPYSCEPAAIRTKLVRETVQPEWKHPKNRCETPQSVEATVKSVWDGWKYFRTPDRIEFAFSFEDGETAGVFAAVLDLLDRVPKFSPEGLLWDVARMEFWP